MTSKDAQDFIRIISSQLSEEGCRHPADAQLKEALQNSVSTLPSGSLKDELHSNFNVYFSKLQSCLSTFARKPTMTEGHVTEPGPEWRVNVLSSKGLEASLAAAKESEDNQEKQELYRRLVLATQRDQKSLSSVLQQWNNDLVHSPPSFPLDAIKFCSHLAGCPETFTPWLQFCFSIYSQMVVRTTGTAAGPDGINAVKSSIFSTLTHAHLIHKHLTCHSQDATYDDTIAAILSLYVDLLSSGDSTEHVLSTVLTLLGHSHEHCLDAVLQTASPASCATAQLVLSLISKLLGSQEKCPSPPLYIKYICCMHKARSLANTVKYDVNQIEQFALLVSVPAALKEWIWKRNISPSVCHLFTKSCGCLLKLLCFLELTRHIGLRGLKISACENIGLKRSWSLNRTSRHLLKSLSSVHVEELLDLATGTFAEAAESIDGEPTTQEVEECLFFLDTKKGESPEDKEECAEEKDDVGSELEDLIGRLPFESDEEELLLREGCPGESSLTAEGFSKRDIGEQGHGIYPVGSSDASEYDITKNSDCLEPAASQFDSDMDHQDTIGESADKSPAEDLSLSKRIHMTKTSKLCMKRVKVSAKGVDVAGTPQGPFEMKPVTTGKKRKKAMDHDMSLSVPIKRSSRRSRK